MTTTTHRISASQEASVSVFERPLWRTVLALLSAIAWGWAFPLVKIGFVELGITADMTASKMVYAGLRFTFAGLLVLAIAALAHRRFSLRRSNDAWFVVFFALVNTALHYAFFYLGMSHSAGARAAILNSMSSFILVLAACAFFKSDRLTSNKMIGCAMGIAGIFMLHAGGTNSNAGFSLLGDGMIMLNAFCAACGGLLTRLLSKRVDIFVGTGYSLALGGAMLLGYGWLCGGTIPQVTLLGVVALACLVAISTFGFMTYNKLLSCNPVGKVAIFNSLIPIVGALTSCWCLGETFYPNYIAAAALATVGIYLVNRDNRKTK